MFSFSLNLLANEPHDQPAGVSSLKTCRGRRIVSESDSYWGVKKAWKYWCNPGLAWSCFEPGLDRAGVRFGWDNTKPITADKRCTWMSSCSHVQLPQSECQSANAQNVNNQFFSPRPITLINSREYPVYTDVTLFFFCWEPKAYRLTSDA